MKHQNRLTNIIKVILLLCLNSILLGDTSQRKISLEEKTDPLDIDDVTLTTMIIYYGEGIIDCPDTLIIEDINLRVKRQRYPFGRYGPYGSGGYRYMWSLLTDTDTLFSACGRREFYWKKGTDIYSTIIDSVSLGRLIDILRSFEMSSVSCMWEHRRDYLRLMPETVMMSKIDTNTTVAVDTNISTETVPSITNINSFRAVTIGSTTWLKMLPETGTNAIVAADVNITTGAVTAMTNAGPLEVVTIGGKTWLKRNLNIATDNSRCYRNNPDMCAKYGRFYNWFAAMNACAGLGDGWRLPDTADWNALIEAVGDREIAGSKLKSNTDWHLDSRGNTPVGTDTFGFSALPGGYHIYDKYGYVGYYGYWWSATSVTGELGLYAYFQIMGFYGEHVGLSR
ncbi:MAG: hypothetical protein LBC84_02360, partial [Prevotellaceae bacterium]|nr:hypothetical protein [Prevotellaceae bacterium]